MFSYRHAFHAGNHADVFKHITLLATLRHLMQKPAALTLVDTHAGAGLYRLDGQQARTAGEAAQGIVKLLRAAQAEAPASTSKSSNNGVDTAAPTIETIATDGWPEAVRDYLQMIASFNTDGQLRRYPGSALLMQRMMRPEAGDRLRLFELHPGDAPLLAQHLAASGAGRAASMARQDGFDALKALLPPPPGAGGSRRALALIDPSYEIKTDYAKVSACLQDALDRFATGAYLVWYPIIGRAQAHALPRRLRTLTQQAGRDWLQATLSIGAQTGAGAGADARAGEALLAAAPAPQRQARFRANRPGPPAPRPPGLRASGMFVVNPPHTLAAQLRQALPVLMAVLGRGHGQGWTVQTSSQAA